MRPWLAFPLGLAMVVAACHHDGSQPITGTAATAIDPVTASDGLRDADESDVDCGGSITPKCGAGAACYVDLNCASGVCASGVCAPIEGETEAGVPSTEPDCTITNTCATGGTSNPNPGCNQGASSDPTLCPSEGD
jgi:hypothetical protein